MFALPYVGASLSLSPSSSHGRTYRKEVVMTPEQRQLIYDLVITPFHNPRQVSLQDFALRFPSALDEGRLALSLLEEVTRAQNSTDLQATLIVGAAFGYTSAHVALLCRLLRDSWHRSHEEIVATLQSLKDPRAVEVLYDASLVPHAYLGRDDFYILVRRCTWALADIGTPDALGKLQLLSASENPVIAGYAQERIDRWHRERHRKGV